MNDFESWFQHFSKSRLGADALRELDKLDDGTEQSWMLRYHVLKSCNSASKFDPSTDVGKVLREEDTKCLSGISTQLETINKLCDFAKQYPVAAGWAFMQTKLELKGRVTIGATGQMPMNEMLIASLNSYAENLRQPIPFVGCGPGFHRFTYGCLSYNEPIEHRHLPPTETMLLADLVLLFRKFSIGSSIRVRGETMPSGGKPRYALAAKFANATLKKDITRKIATDRVTKLVNRNSELRFIGWNSYK